MLSYDQTFLLNVLSLRGIESKKGITVVYVIVKTLRLGCINKDDEERRNLEILNM